MKRKLLLTYDDPETAGGLGGVDRFARARGITRREARSVLERNLAYSLHKPPHRRLAILPVLVFNRDQQWVADLVEIQQMARYNKAMSSPSTLGCNLWKIKTGKEVVKAFQNILKTSKRRSQSLQTDKGKEFYNATLQQWLKTESIHHFSTERDAKASVVERFTRTLKGRMYWYFTAANTLKYVDVLPNPVRQYNADHHRYIGMAPNDVTVKNGRQMWQRLYGKRLQKVQKRKALRKGERIRLSKRVRTFKRGTYHSGRKKCFWSSRWFPDLWSPTRIWWHTSKRHVLWRGFTKSHRGWRHSVARWEST